MDNMGKREMWNEANAEVVGDATAAWESFFSVGWLVTGRGGTRVLYRSVLYKKIIQSSSTKENEGREQWSWSEEHTVPASQHKGLSHFRDGLSRSFTWVNYITDVLQKCASIDRQNLYNKTILPVVHRLDNQIQKINPVEVT